MESDDNLADFDLPKFLEKNSSESDSDFEEEGEEKTNTNNTFTKRTADAFQIQIRNRMSYQNTTKMMQMINPCSSTFSIAFLNKSSFI